MTWSFERVTDEHKEYSQNPLVSTDIEIRFHPILKIEDPDFIQRFQDGLRDMYPKYSEAKVTGVDITQDEKGSQSIQIQNDLQHVFSNSKNTCGIRLTKQNLTISNSDHKNRRALTSDFITCLNTLNQVLGKDISPLRLGVRYVNIIDKIRISEDLKNEVEWSDLISDDFLKLPSDIADISNTSFQMELHSEMDIGSMSLRYGLAQTPARRATDQNIIKTRDNFRFDIDRFLVLDGSIDNTEDTLLNFTNDIYSLFVHVIDGKLNEWMDLEKDEGN